MGEGENFTATGEEGSILWVSPDFSSAEVREGERVVFTRSERLIVARLARQPNRITTRDQILDALTGTGSEKNDRNVDFLINRLRQKLGDDARKPRYIATRYGEGYVWIARTSGVGADLANAYLVVGPVGGLDNLAEGKELAERLASDLRDAFRSELPDKQIVLAPDCPPASDFPDRHPALSVALTFFIERGVIHCVAMARQFRTSRILAVERLVVPSGDVAEAMRCAEHLARLLLQRMWRVLATEPGSDVPMPVLMHLASTLPDHTHGTLEDSDDRLVKLAGMHARRYVAAWKDNDKRLKGLLKASPDDHHLKIMYATHIHSKYVTFGHILFENGIDDRSSDEDEIEALVLSALPHVQADPEYAIMAAKLLHFLQRGFDDVSRTVAEEAYGASTSIASSLTIIGQLRGFAGEFEAALDCLDQALNLVERGTKAHLYTLTIKMQVLRVLADFERLSEAKAELYGVSGAAMIFYEPLFANPDKLSLRARAVVRLLSRAKAAAILRMNNYVSARLFAHPQHRANAILTPLTLVVRRFGKAAVPEDVVATHPGLLDRFP